MLERLESLPFDGLLDWTAALQLWQYHRDDFDLGAPQPNPAGGKDPVESDDSESEEKRELTPAIGLSDRGERETEPVEEKEASAGKEGRMLCRSLLKKREITFRVTCTRGGRKHSFSSPDAARSFGAGLARYFDWKVQLKGADIEVLLAIMGNEVRVGVALNREAKFKRNISHFGPTTLRATIGYGMLRCVCVYVCVCVCVCVCACVCVRACVCGRGLLRVWCLRCADIQPGDVVLDPLCGGGTISLEVSCNSRTYIYGWLSLTHVTGRDPWRGLLHIT